LAAGGSSRSQLAAGGSSKSRLTAGRAVKVNYSATGRQQGVNLAIGKAAKVKD
jgi:hypothetical protein